MRRRHSRRDLFTSWGEILRGASPMRSRPQLDQTTVLRPPGALSPDSEFLTACSGCGDCEPACPKHSILTFTDDQDRSLPGIVPAHKPCHLCSDLPCVAACKDGALAAPTDPSQVRIGLAVVDPRICITFRGELCLACFKACPYPHQAIMMIGSRPLVSNTACTGCGLCEHACPTEPRAITIVPERSLIPGLRIPEDQG